MAENELGVQALPDGPAWLGAYAGIPDDERHLAMHELHLVGVNEHDAPFVTPELMSTLDVAWSPTELRSRLAGLEAAGITEVVYQPAGDIERELSAYMRATRG